MESDLHHRHVRNRLKIIQLVGMSAMVIFFVVIFFVGHVTLLNTLPAQLMLLLMAVMLAVGYGSLLGESNNEPKAPLAIFFLLNFSTSILIWSTGLLYSPFIILYAILIIATTQLYHYGYGLLQTVLALAGLIAVYGMTVYRILPYQSLLPDSDISILYQPTAVILLYGLLYASLLFFAVFASSSARMMLFRPMKKLDLDTTFQEKIIQEMPTSVIVTDADLSILGYNPAASVRFPCQNGHPLTEYLQLPEAKLKELLEALSGNGKDQELSWKLDTGEKMQVTIEVHVLKGEKKETNTYIIFLR